MTREHDDIQLGIEHDLRNFSVVRRAHLQLLASFQGTFFQRLVSTMTSGQDLGIEHDPRDFSVVHRARLRLLASF